MWKKIWQWIEYNRFIVIAPVIGFVIWAIAVGCTPETISPIDPTRLLSAPELQFVYEQWQADQKIIMARFEGARLDLEQQQLQQEKLKEAIIHLASGGVADLPGLIQLLISGGFLGAVADNVRKRGLIAGLKRNNEN